jgi:hypothetical protein
MRPTVAVTLGYDLPRSPGQLGVRGAIRQTLAAAHVRLFTTFLEHAGEYGRSCRGLVERTPCTT